MKGVPAVRKALCVAVLVVLAWTSVAAAQGLWDLPNFWANMPRSESDGLMGQDGDDWLAWSDTARTFWVSGFLAGTGRVTYFLAEQGRPPLTMISVWSNTDWAVESALTTSNFRYRVGAYVLELDVLYREPLNRSIRLIDAMYIANERLNGREVNLDQWRAKGQRL